MESNLKDDIVWAIAYCLSEFCFNSISCREEARQTCKVAELARKYDEESDYEVLYKDNNDLVIKCNFNSKRIAERMLKDYLNNVEKVKDDEIKKVE